MKYITSDNGRHPFLVDIVKKTVCIYDNADPSKKLLKKYTNVIKVFVGKSSGKSDICDHSIKDASKFDGNTILIQIAKREYVFIGIHIYSFTTKDNIINYYSPVGGNDVPYPVAEGTNSLYFMLDCVYVEKKYLPYFKPPSFEDSYKMFFPIWDNDAKKWIKYTGLGHFAKKMAVKKIK